MKSHIAMLLHMHSWYSSAVEKWSHVLTTGPVSTSKVVSVFP